MGEEPHGDSESEDADSASVSSGEHEEEPRLMYHQVVEMQEQLDDVAGLLTCGGVLGLCAHPEAP